MMKRTNYQNGVPMCVLKNSNSRDFEKLLRMEGFQKKSRNSSSHHHWKKKDFGKITWSDCDDVSLGWAIQQFIHDTGMNPMDVLDVVNPKALKSGKLKKIEDLKDENTKKESNLVEKAIETLEEETTETNITLIVPEPPLEAVREEKMNYPVTEVEEIELVPANSLGMEEFIVKTIVTKEIYYRVTARSCVQAIQETYELCEAGLAPSDEIEESELVGLEIRSINPASELE